MEPTQLSLKEIQRHNLVEELKHLVKEKQETSRIRKEKKNQGHKQSGDYARFFWRSDEKRSWLRKDLRALHLANNFLLKTPYKKVEGYVREENRLLNGYCPVLNSLIALVNRYSKEEITKKDVVSWIKGKSDG